MASQGVPEAYCPGVQGTRTRGVYDFRYNPVTHILVAVLGREGGEDARKSGEEGGRGFQI